MNTRSLGKLIYLGCPGAAALYLGSLIIKTGGFSTQLGDWIPLNSAASFFVGLVVILCGLWFFYFAIKNLLKSRRLK